MTNGASRKIEDFGKFKEGCSNLVAFARLREGDQVLIIYDDVTYDELFASSLKMACEEAGAGEVFIMKTKRPSSQWLEPGKILKEALKASDIVFNFSFYRLYNQPWGLLATTDHCTKLVRTDLKYAWMLESEFARFPAELFYTITRKTAEMMSRGKRLRVTSKLGMDLSVGINPFALSAGGHLSSTLPAGLPGERVVFPGGLVGVNPQDPVNGVLVMNFIHPAQYKPPQYMLDAPIKITIEDKRATKIEGCCADWVEETLQKEGDENSRYLGEVMLGPHPKGMPLGWPDVSPLDWFIIFHYRTQLLHCALGRGSADLPPYSKTHMDFFVINPTVYVDNETLIDNGQSLIHEDPEVIKIAEKYGDPKELLSMPPLPEGFLPDYLKGEG